jgi:membrane fusion protein, multidrug efflux system
VSIKGVLKTAAWLIVAGAIGSAGYGFMLAQDKPGKPAAANASVAPAPVNVALVERKDFPEYLDSLGQVQPWNTVTVRARVDGQIDKIFFNEGQDVKENDLLVQIDPRPLQAALDQVRAKKALDEALIANSRLDLQRFENVGTLAQSQQKIDTQRALVAQQEAQLKQDAAAIDTAELQLGYTTIRAPIGGRVGFRLVDQGNIVRTTDANGIVTIAQIEPISVIFTEPEEQIPRITAALKSGPLNVIALSSDSKRELGRGTLALVDNKVDAASGSIRLKAEFPNKDVSLWPGLSVSTRLLVETHKNVIVVPDVAVQRGPGKLYAYVVKADGKAELRDLKVGIIQDGKAIVEAGLVPGDRVVTSGYYRLQPNAPVQILNGDAAAPSRTSEAERRPGSSPKTGVE